MIHKLCYCLHYFLVPSKFVDNSDEVYGILHEYKALYCCAQGYDNITWQKNTSDGWKYLQTDLDNGQKYQITKLEPDDNTMFRCTLFKDGRNVTSLDVNLIVEGK